MVKRFKEIYRCSYSLEKPRKSKRLKIDLSEDEHNFTAQKQKLYIKLNKGQDLRRGRLDKDSIKQDFPSLFKLEPKSEHLTNPHSNSDAHSLRISIYSNLTSPTKLNTPGYWSQLADSIINSDRTDVIQKERESFTLSKQITIINKQAPLTCPTDKPVKNYFSIDKPIVFSPQNLSTLIFNPQKKTNTRMAMTLNFIREKLGQDRFEIIKNSCRIKGLDKEHILSLLKPSEKDIFKLIEYVFKEQSPSTQDSGSLDVDVNGLKYK